MKNPLKKKTLARIREKCLIIILNEVHFQFELSPSAEVMVEIEAVVVVALNWEICNEISSICESRAGTLA